MSINIKGNVQYGPRLVTSGLVLLLDPKNTLSFSGIGSVWSDLSGNGYTASLLNSPLHNDTGFIFDGVNDLVSITNIPKYSLSQGTIMMWFYPTSATDKRLFMQYNNDLNRMSITHQGASSTINFFSGHSSTSILSFNSTANSVPLNTWTSVACTYDFTGDNFQIYLNGQFNASAISTAPTPDAIGEITIAAGKDFDEPSPYYFGWFAGRISLVLVYSRVLTGQEILQNHTAFKSRYPV